MSNRKSKKKNNLRDQTLNSTLWGFLDKGVSFLVTFIIGIILARLLPPSDFGLIGLALIVIGFGQIFVNLGLGPALIQRKAITDKHIRVVFTTSVIAGSILMIAIFLSAPIVSTIFQNENLVPIIKALSLIFLLSGFQIPSQALLTKRLDFKSIFYVSLGRNILYGFVTVLLALWGYGVWSLVLGNIFQRLVSLIGSYWFVRHPLKPLFAKKEINDLARFGSGMTLNGILNYFALKGDYFVIGRILGANALGLYTKAYNLMQAPTNQFVRVLADVLFPAASKIHDQEKKVREVFLRIMRIVAFCTIPICFLMTLLGPELIIGLYGKNWTGAVVPFQILASYGILKAMYSSAAAFLRAKGLVYSLFTANLVYGIFVVVGVWFGASNYGLVGATWAAGIAITIIWALIMDLNCRAMGIRRLKILETLYPGIILGSSVTILTGISKYILKLFSSSFILNLIFLIITGLIFTVSMLILIPQQRLDYLPIEIFGIIKKMIPQKYSAFCNSLLSYIK